MGRPDRLGMDGTADGDGVKTGSDCRNRLSRPRKSRGRSPLFSLYRELTPVLSRTRLALFLDFDGTLAPIVDDPDRAALPRSTRGSLLRLVGLPEIRITVVSGRSLSDLRERVGIRRIALAGNHGLEIEGPGFRYRPRLPAGYRRTLDRVRIQLSDLPARYPGTELEDKELTLSFHYRRADWHTAPEAVVAFHRLVAPYLDRMEIRTGKRVLEVRPPTRWGKGEAVLWLLANGRWLPKGAGFTAIYIGDDKTDEDAFRAIRESGVTVRVGRSARSAARYYLDDTESVARFLDRLVRLREGVK
jgi:trehalose 6-phosphate phosphatase